MKQTGPVNFTIIPSEICDVIKHSRVFGENFKAASELWVLRDLFFSCVINCKRNVFGDLDIKSKLKSDVIAEDPGDVCLTRACMETEQETREKEGGMEIFCMRSKPL